MAPVKRSTLTATQPARTTRAAATAKKNVLISEKKSDIASLGKAASTSTRSTTSARNGRKIIAKEERPEQEILEDVSQTENEIVELVRPKTGRATRATVASVGFAAAPRRRVKVTPLDAPSAERASTRATTKVAKAKTTEKSIKRTSTHTKSLDAQPADAKMEEAPAVEPKSKPSKKSASKSKEHESENSIAPNTRGRLKSQSSARDVSHPAGQVEEPKVTRSTRQTRAASVASSAALNTTDVPPVAKSTGVAKKKVTFQDMPDENDKENLPLPEIKSRRGVVKKDSTGAKAATGLRAKPLRKPAATITRGRKAVSTASNIIDDASIQEEPAKSQQKINRVLTPKKITQIARSCSPEQNDTELSDGEDELNGGKTPIRDLSVSPRRPTTTALAKALSPAKKLDFGQSLVPKSPEKTTNLGDHETDHTGILASPARRLAASPFKDGLKESPKRGLHDSTRLLFPNHQDGTSSVSLNASTSHSSSQAIHNMSQSPKRVGLLDPNFFSQSAMKPSVNKSPFKSSLFGTPAKRLFSPAKKSATPSLNRSTVTETIEEQEGGAVPMEIESEISASSHFRSSTSPLRVMRVEPTVSSVDFDDSILGVRSPFKIRKSPVKMPSQPDFNVAIEAEKPAKADSKELQMSAIVISQPAIIEVAAKPQSLLEPTANMDDPFATVDPMHVNRAEEAVDAAIKTTFTEEMPVASPVRRKSLSQILFRSTGDASIEESSEDELAGEKTPIKQYARIGPSNGNNLSRSRVSDGAIINAAGKNFGFTPLAAQMSGWLATSPDKSPNQQKPSIIRQMSKEFSPMARQHIEGEVVVSRDSTPVRKLSKRMSLQPTSSSKLTATKRQSVNLRKSLAQRQSLGLASNAESPARDRQFEEYMEIRAMEEEADNVNAFDEHNLENYDQDFDLIMDIDGEADQNDELDDTILDGEAEVERQSPVRPGDLTTDLIKFTHASDTAIVDFQKLAEEADQMASDELDQNESGNESRDNSASGQGDTIPLDRIHEELDHSGELHTQSISPAYSSEADDEDEVDPPTEDDHANVQSPLLQPVSNRLDSPSMLVIDENNFMSSPPSIVRSTIVSPIQSMNLRTPQPNLRIYEKRIINTVVSKVPLKPEGTISPIKMPKKRSQSFGNSEASPPKRISFENLRQIAPKDFELDTESPDRRVRTSVAPSPGGTSTPATSRYRRDDLSRFSLGAVSTFSTPGQTSFAVDDFGDSTLDGIELPEDFDVTDFAIQTESPAQSVRGAASITASVTPKTVVKATPVTSKRELRHAAAPVTASKKTPRTAQKASTCVTSNTELGRTPLAPIGKGVLNGATIFVDVRTSEGADASSIFTELLTQMGAKCVREWKWSSRASLAARTEDESAENRIGITHVVYKDGGKRTLEKVRDTKGDVFCVGVAWVLDCERENKWLDESNYTVDTSILARGGSKRRKSMEPRALLVAGDGSVSRSRGARFRSVSGEMNELMKRELLKTPARVQSPTTNHNEEADSDNDENVEQSTPTGYVSYDPQTAMTPGTPYQVSQGKKLTQMSAPPKQQNKSLFEDEDGENDDTFMEREKGDDGAVKDAKKFRMKNLGDMAKRRRTLGWKPTVGSPLGRI